MDTKDNKHVVDWKDFRKYGHELVDYIADYIESIENKHVQHTVTPGYLKEHIPLLPPNNPEDFHQIMDDFTKYIIPGMNNWQHPNFYAFFPANASPPAVLADMLSKMFSSIAFNWNTSPASTELDQIVMDWLCQALHLPEFYLSKFNGGGVIHGSASETTLVSILSARDKTIKEKNCSIYQLRFYCSEQSHSSVNKGLMIAGINKSQLHIIQTNDIDLSSDYNELLKIIEEDIKNGFIPCHFSFNIGSTAGGAVDNLSEIGKIAQKYEIWFHVDAAYAGSALICPEYQYLTKGLEYTDSFVMNPHKWLLTNFPCTAGWFKNKKYVLNALSITPEYLRSAEHDSGVVTDYRDWQIPLGRGFNSLKLWFVIRYYGIKGLIQHIRHHIHLSNIFYNKIKDDPNFEIVVPPFLSLICFRLKGDNKLNEDFYNKMNENKDFQFTHCKLHDKYTIRFVVGSPNTEERHVLSAYNFVKELSNQLMNTK